MIYHLINFPYIFCLFRNCS